MFHSSIRIALGLLALAVVSAAPARAQDLFVANKGSGTIERITSGGTASVFATGLGGPTGLAFDKFGNLYVASNGNGIITKYAFTNNTLSSTGTTYFTQANAGFQGLTFDSMGNLYAASSATNSILKITAPNTATTYYSGSSTNALNAPYSLVFDKNGTLYVGNIGSGTNANSIVKISSAGTFSTFSTGTVTAYGLAFDSTGKLYAANANAANVLTFTSAGGTGTVFASGFTNPHGAAFDSAGNLYVASTSASPAAIIKIAPDGTKTTFDTSGLSSPVGLALMPTPAPAPEPSPLKTLALGALGLGALALTARRRTDAN